MKWENVRCHLDSNIWGNDGMSDKQVAQYYESLDYCKKKYNDFNRWPILEQDAEVIMQMLRIKDREPKQEYIEMVNGIDSFIAGQKAFKSLPQFSRKKLSN